MKLPSFFLSLRDVYRRPSSRSRRDESTRTRYFLSFERRRPLLSFLFVLPFFDLIGSHPLIIRPEYRASPWSEISPKLLTSSQFVLTLATCSTFSFTHQCTVLRAFVVAQKWPYFYHDGCPSNERAPKWPFHSTFHRHDDTSNRTR